MVKGYKIGEIAKMLELKPFVIRFWESEFSQINPERSAKGQRVYTVQDFQTIKIIKQLLHDKGMTISGAKRILEEGEEAVYNALNGIAETNAEESKFIQASLIPELEAKSQQSKNSLLPNKRDFLLEIHQELQEINSLLGKK